MPYQDGTGPYGDGRPGRGMGACLRNVASNGSGRMRRAGCGSGLRFRNRAASAPGTQIDPIYPLDRSYLEEQKAVLSQRLEWLEKELAKQKED